MTEETLKPDNPEYFMRDSGFRSLAKKTQDLGVIIKFLRYNYGPTDVDDLIYRYHPECLESMNYILDLLEKYPVKQ